MAEKRADELVKGDVVSLKGHPYVVLKAKPRGKRVRLTVDGRGGSFTDDVKAKERYRVVAPVLGPGSGSDDRRGAPTPKTQRSGPLHSPSGAQQRWATPVEHDRSLEAPAEPERSTAWDETASKGEKRLVEDLAAKLIGVEVEGGKLIVPPATDTTLLGHLATMHGRRFDGVTFAEAKAWARKHDPGGPATAVQVMDALTLERARELHESLHVDFASVPRPHWHREKAPR